MGNSPELLREIHATRRNNNFCSGFLLTMGVLCDMIILLGQLHGCSFPWFEMKKQTGVMI